MKLKIALIFFLAINSFATQYAVVSNILLENLNKNQIRAIFLKRLTHLNKKHLVPVNLPLSSPVRAAFEKEVLKMSKKRLKSYWVKQHYLGNRPPVNMKSEKSALTFTKNVQGAITYVKIENISKKVNILYRWED